MVLVFFASGQAFFLAFGSYLFQFRNLSRTLYTLLELCMGLFDFNAMVTAQVFHIFLIVVVGEIHILNSCFIFFSRS